MKHRILFWVSFVLAVIAATYLSVRISMVYLGNGNSAVVKTILISSENGKIDRTAMAELVGIRPGTPMFAIDLQNVLVRIMSAPDTDRVSVRRLPNGNIAVRVRMRTAIAVWTDGVHYYPLTADGTVINRPDDSAPENSLVFRGKLPDDLQPIVGALARIPGLSVRIDHLEWIDNRRWNLVVRDGPVVKLPESDIVTAMLALGDLNKKTNVLDRKITVLDLRDPDRTFVKLITSK